MRVSIRDVSAGGVSIAATRDFDGVTFEPGVTAGRLAIDPLGVIVKEETLPLTFVHTSGAGDASVYGFEFGAMEPDEYYVLADLMYADSDALPNFLATRRKHKSIFAGSGRFIWWGISEPFRAISYLIKKEKEKQPEQALDGPPKTSLSWLRRFAAAGKEQTAASAAVEAAMKKQSA